MSAARDRFNKIRKILLGNGRGEPAAPELFSATSVRTSPDSYFGSVCAKRNTFSLPCRHESGYSEKAQAIFPRQLT
jgi:hypothetical protein